MDVGIYEAKSKLSRLVERVEAGDEVVLTRHGRPVARIVRVALPGRRRQRATLLGQIRGLSKRVKLPRTLSIRQVVEEGRD